MKISVIIPAYNAGHLIQNTIKSLKNSYQVDEVLVVDDGSNDDTSSQAESTGALVVRHKKNLGKGAALNTGASKVKGDIIVLLDADLGKSAREFSRLLIPVLENRADVTIAKFPPSPVAGGFGLVKGLAARGTYHLTGKIISSPLSGQRAMTRQVLNSILPFASGYGVEVAATVDIIKKGWRLEEVEIEMEHAFTGRDLAGFLHRGRQFYDICWTLLGKSLGE